MVWTQFWDMHSGGGTKLDWEMIYIEAPEDEAEVIFYNKFGRNPNNISCTCCGEDYSVTEDSSLELLTGYHRNAYWDSIQRKYIEEADPSRSWANYITLDEYLAQDDVYVIYAHDIQDDDRYGEIPETGWVWAG